MRLFVAVELDEMLRSAAEKTADGLRRRIGRGLDARWVLVGNMHLTVRFIGHVAEERAPSILDALKPSMPIAPFDLALGECGVFPPHGAPRVFWIGLKEGLPSLKAMHEEFNRRVLPFGFEPEPRPYSAHLTLARVKNAPRGSGAAAHEAVRAVRVPPASGRVSEAIVFESRLSPHGPTYIPLVHVPLQP
jgi:RNA 2',3'-cyclic 3'-phosphodiesterase